ncbi:hypothetical protein GT204_34150 [Streptomyces sp. SID4919]|uniref:hypothetical protein n=1 Tax=unclassified Streptomyces TaxID=2593676 RepID=UPI000823E0C8|nr:MULTISPECIES: hypothetical protein [unclassified Streptomyces]MYY13773.1 hypothetical protein [Streptomyces sp. SID4919]SCK30129.1 hypothetical protein YW7DRAFT_02357 [Streptomyces sp. AmelKG-E11A]
MELRFIAGPVGVGAGGVALAFADAAVGWWLAWSVCALVTAASVAYMIRLSR